MTKCIEYWEKLKKEPGFCGLGSTLKSQLDYLEYTDEISEKFDIPIRVIYKNASHGALKPVLRFRKGSQVRDKATAAIVETIKNKHAITGKYINSIIGFDQKPKRMIEDPKVIVAPISEPHREQINSNSVKDKIRLLTSALTSGQMDIINEVIKFEGLNNEYEAMALVIKWAAMRIGK